jgi:hypothetical protein
MTSLFTLTLHAYTGKNHCARAMRVVFSIDKHSLVLDLKVGKITTD